MQWHGEKRSNDTHASTTDPESRLYRKSNSTAATLCYSGHLLMENRNALIVEAEREDAVSCGTSTSGRPEVLRPGGARFVDQVTERTSYDRRP